MKEKNIKTATQNPDKLHVSADALSRNPELIKICFNACFDEQLHEEAINNPMAFLHSRGMTIPDGLTVQFFKRPPKYLPFPDWTPFIFEWTNCRTYWLKECDANVPPKCELKEVEICFGFRIYPNPMQPGPVG